MFLFLFLAFFFVLQPKLSNFCKAFSTKKSINKKNIQKKLQDLFLQDCPQEVLLVMEEHARDVGVQALGTWALSNFVGISRKRARELYELGGKDRIFVAMSEHSLNDTIKVWGGDCFLEKSFEISLFFFPRNRLVFVKIFVDRKELLFFHEIDIFLRVVFFASILF